MKFFFKCSETAEVCDKYQYEEANYWEVLKMKLHLLLCKYCRKYATTNNKLTESLKSADIKTLSDNNKELLKAQLNQEIKTNSNL